jgi:hypothetical protein
VLIQKGKVTKMFRGVDAIRFAEVAKKELYYFKMDADSCIDRVTYELDEPTSEEMVNKILFLLLL